MSYEDRVITGIKCFSPKNGDILVLYIKPDSDLLEVDELYTKLRSYLDENDLENLNVLAIPDNVAISMLSEQEMLEAGWVRKTERRGYEFI